MNITYNNINHYEYYGIHKLWTLAHKFPDKIFLYLHTKCMSSDNDNNPIGSICFTRIITEEYKKIMDIFMTKPEINKVCIASSDIGFCWHNFWWARGTYIVNNTVEPNISDNDRYYYEGWLHGLDNNIKNDCYSIVKGTTESSDQLDAVKIAHLVINKIKDKYTFKAFYGNINSDMIDVTEKVKQFQKINYIFIPKNIDFNHHFNHQIDNLHLEESKKLFIIVKYNTYIVDRNVDTKIFLE